MGFRVVVVVVVRQLVVVKAPLKMSNVCVCSLVCEFHILIWGGIKSHIELDPSLTFLIFAKPSSVQLKHGKTAVITNFFFFFPN